jgi:hypothetical protein
VIPFVILVYLENGNLGKNRMRASNFASNWGKAPQKLKTFDCNFGENTMGRKEVFEQLSVFKSGMISAEYAKRSGHTFTRKT